MQYDIFFSISQTPVDGHMPSEREMFANFFDQVKAADAQGFGVAWVAESHLSSQVQKTNRNPVIPHWEGEVGLNTDILQLAQKVFSMTERIEVGSAISNILCMGGPVAHAERLATFLTLHGLDADETRRIHYGFASGRFNFMNEASGITPRDIVEEAAWPALKGFQLQEACEIFLRLLRGDVIHSGDIPELTMSRANFRSDEDWEKVQKAAMERDGLSEAPTEIAVQKRWVFENIKLVPQAFRRDLLQLIIGSHDPALQEHVNTLAPVQVFNLSITRPDIIEDTHKRLAAAFHPDGGEWTRGHMPRTTFVFLNAEAGLTPEQQSKAAGEEARKALGEYWKALQGTIDPARIEKAAQNALIGNPDEVAAQIVERFHPDDRLMLWFDFFNHDSARVIRNQQAFMDEVAPRVQALIGKVAS